MTRKRLFKEISKSISVRVPKSKAVWMLPHIKDYIIHLEGGGKSYTQLLVLLRNNEKIIDDLRDLSQLSTLTGKDMKIKLSQFEED